MSTTSLSPSASDFYTTLKKVVTEIEPGHRVQVLVPRTISHEKVSSKWDAPGVHNWDNLENIQMDFRGSILNPNVFMVLRFDQKDEMSDVVVDVCHFSS